MDVGIRQEKAGDCTALFALNCEAFQRAEEGMLVDALRRNPDVFIPELSIVAEYEGKLVGHILLTVIGIVDDKGYRHESLALAPMAVWPDYQKQGIGQRLVEYALKTARELGYRSVVVLGHATYYSKFGFVRADEYGIKCPYSVPTEVFLVKELVPGGLDGVSGLVYYPAEFQEV